MQKSIDEIKYDYHLFIDIQMAKYLKSVNKNEFSSEDEAKNIMGRILQTWNDQIAGRHERLDTSSTEAKTAWFNSIEIDFEKGSAPVQPALNIHNIRKLTSEMIAYYDELFPFMPKGAVMFLLFAGPALEAYGYSIERFNKLVDGEKPTEIEKYLLHWAYDITFGAMAAYMKKNNSKRDNLLTRTVQIAKEELDEKTALKVVAQIYTNIEEHFSELHKEKNKTIIKKKNK